jgi:hypothetical protein
VTSCVRNIKGLTQAICVYTSTSGGYFENFDWNDPAENLYGALFEGDGWNDLGNLVCPAASEHVPPDPQGFGNPLDMTPANATIDYWIVFTGNMPNESQAGSPHYREINTVMSPGSNVLVIESFDSGTQQWTTAHQDGGSTGYLNGSASFEDSVPLQDGTPITQYSS